MRALDPGIKPMDLHSFWRLLTVASGDLAVTVHVIETHGSQQAHCFGAFQPAGMWIQAVCLILVLIVR